MSALPSLRHQSGRRFRRIRQNSLPRGSRGNVAVLPRRVSYAEGALNEPFSCAYNGSQHCHIQPGDYVLVVGSGAIGLMHAKLAKLAGAGRVVISDLSPERLEECLGA